jgi:hypothetical protein
MRTFPPTPVFHPCDFCKARGILEVHIFNREGWYFCAPCLKDLTDRRELTRALRLNTPSRKDPPAGL